MRYLVSRLLIATMLLTLVAIPGVFLAQDDPTISVTPESGAVGAGVFQVDVSGLTPENTYTIEFVINGIVVFASDEEANSDGEINFAAASTDDDEPGIYTVQVISNDSILVATEFELVAADDGPAESDNSDTDEQTDETPVESVGTLSVTPQSGPISTVHTIRIRDLESDTPYTVEITASDSEEVVYRRLWTSNQTGGIDIEVFAEEDDVPGQQVIRVFDNLGNLVAQGSFTVDPPPDRNAVIEVTPQVALAGSDFVITVTGLAQFDSVSAQITSETDEVVDTILARASSTGVAELTFLSSDDLVDGTYTISISVDDEELAQSQLTIGDAPPPADTEQDDPTEEPEATPTEEAESADAPVELTAEVTSDPDVSLLGETVAVTVTGLESGQAITFTVLNRDDEVEFSTTRIADDNGEFSINLSSSDDDELGTYPIEVTDATSGRLLGTGALVLAQGQSAPPEDTEDTTSDDTEPASEGSITVDPVAGAVGSTHTITLSGMPADVRIGVTIRYAEDGTLAQSSVVNTDADGNGSFEFTSRDINLPGDYNISAVQGGVGVLAEAILTVEGDIETTDTDTTDEENTEDISTEAETTEEAAEDTSAQTFEMGEPQVFEEALSASGTSTLSFSGNEGKYVLIGVESDEFDTSAAVYSDDFLEIGFNNDALGTTNSLIGPVQLPYTGMYSIEVFSSSFDGSGVGEPFTVTITPIAVPTVTFGEPIPFELSPDMPAIYVAMDVVAGDNLDIMGNTSGTLDTVIRVLDNASFEVAYDDDGGAGFEAEINNLIIDFPGTYIVELSTFAGDATGSGELMVSRNPVQSLEDGTVRITLNDKQFRDLVVFDAFAGELVTLNLQTVSGSVEDLIVSATVDGMQVMYYSTMGVPANLPLTFVMPMDGEVVVTFEEFGFGSGITLDVSVTKSRRN